MSQQEQIAPSEPHRVLTSEDGRPQTTLAGAVRRFANSPGRLLRDAMPSRREARRPGDYVQAMNLWRKLRSDGFTMLGAARGRTLFTLARQLERDGIAGDIVDCGVWNGGSTALLSAGASSGRRIWAFDSFEGLPEASIEVDSVESAGWEGSCQGTEENVRLAIQLSGANPDLRVVKGWFQDTFPTVQDEIQQVGLIHADGDWYDSVQLTLRTFYPKLAVGGYVVVDDYHFWAGAKTAADEFRTQNGITASLREIDGNAIYWRKEHP